MKSFFNYAKNRILYNLFRFIFFLIIALILLSSKVNALESDFTNLSVQGYNNNGNSLTSPNVFNCDLGTCGMEITTIANSYGGAWGIQSPIPLVQGHQYAITLRIRSSNGTIALSSKPNIALGSQMNYAKSNYESSSYNCETTYSKYVGNQTLQYIIYSQNTLNYLIIPFSTTTSTTASFMIDNIIIDDLGITPLTENQINNVLNNQTSILQNDINSVNDNINSVNDNLNKVEESINNSINDSLNDCVNLFDYNSNIMRGSFIMSDGTIGSDSGLFYQNSYISVQPNTNYTISSNYSQLYRIAEYNNGKVFLNRLINTNSRTSYTFTTSSNTYFLRISAQFEGISTIQIEKGSSSSTFTPFGECKSKIDSTNDKLDEANETSKGIWDTLKNLPKTILDGFLDLLLKVFVPEEDFFSNWFDEVKSMFEEQLGFLATPFTIIIEFVERFLELNSSTDIIINIPDITVPNFENITLIEATSFNWSSLLNSKDSLKNLWTLYLDFIDVFLILNFIGLCSSIYGRIFGGDTSNFEYYTVEDTYTVNDSTGEVTNHRLNQRKTTRKKVN